MKKLILFLLLFGSIQSFSQKGINFSFSAGYKIPLAAGNLDPTESLFSQTNTVADNPTPTGSYGVGFYTSLSAGYVFPKFFEAGVTFIYQQSPLIKVEVDDYLKQTYKGATYTAMPYIRARKHLRGPFIPYIQLGIPIISAEATIEGVGGKEYYLKNYYSKAIYPSGIGIGINGGFGFLTVANNHLQLFFEANFTGFNFIPTKIVSTTGWDNKPQTTKEIQINSKEQQEKYGNSVILPFSNWGVGFGIRYNINKMIEGL